MLSEIVRFFYVVRNRTILDVVRNCTILDVRLSREFLCIHYSEKFGNKKKEKRTVQIEPISAVHVNDPEGDQIGRIYAYWAIVYFGR
jgi:hypothetical protein